MKRVLITALALLPSAANGTTVAMDPISLSRPRAGVQWGGAPVGNYTSDRGLTYGLLAQRFDYGAGLKPFDNLITIQGRHATRGPDDLKLAYEATGVSRYNLRIDSHVCFSRNEYEPYFGLGDNTEFSGEALKSGGYYYTDEQKQVSVGGRVALTDGFDVTASARYTVDAAQSNGPATVYERDFGAVARHSQYASFRFGLVRDRRDSEFIPSEGYQASALVTSAPAWLSTRDSWARLDLDYRRHDPLISNRWLWFSSQVRYTWSDSEAPIIEKAKLGSRATVRGLPFSRYLSNHSGSLRGELRSIWFRQKAFDYPIKAGTGLFIDAGKIGHSPQRFMNSELHTTWGFSIFGSCFTDDFLGGADVGFSKDGTALYLQLGHAF